MSLGSCLSNADCGKFSEKGGYTEGKKIMGVLVHEFTNFELKMFIDF